MEIISKNIKNTKDLAKKIKQQLQPQKNKATIFGLYGDLGTGKTTLMQFIAKELKIKQRVNSPTFVIMRRYIIPKPSKFKHLIHMDAYRLKNHLELLPLNWEEIVSDPGNLIFIEWPENIKKALPKKHHQIHIEHLKEGYRRFKIKKA